jgi:hemerythrin-like domain-containing protein
MSGKYERRNGEGDHRIKDDDPAAITLLKEEHHIFRKLFDRAEDASDEEIVEIAEELCMRLAVHMTIEEEILYPALKPVLGDDEVNEGIVEHQSGKRIVAELEQLDGDETLFRAKVHVLGEETVHHIDEEDEDMFEDAKEAHRDGRLDLDAIGEKLRARQQQLYDEIARSGDVGETRDAMPDEVPTVGG